MQCGARVALGCSVEGFPPFSDAVAAPVSEFWVGKVN